LHILPYLLADVVIYVAKGLFWIIRVIIVVLVIRYFYFRYHSDLGGDQGV